MDIDVFNGDADGLCALVQLRLAEPVESQLITGIKRDIQLLDRVEATDADRVTVLDISLAKNRVGLDKILQQGARVFYIDHHQSGDIPEHPALQTIIDTDPATCTSLLVNEYLHGQYRAWAVTAAFGDNLHESAIQAAGPLSLHASRLEQLKNLGTYLNYNGYGSSLTDLHFSPAALYEELRSFSSPFEFINENESIFQKLRDGYLEDMAKALNIPAEYSTDTTAVYILPDEAWSRRVSGVFSNDLVNKNPQKAHAVLSYNNSGGFLVSVRAPLINRTGADELCSSFATGGGRKAAAGINHLPQTELVRFINAFEGKYS